MQLRSKLNPEVLVRGDFHLQGRWYIQDKPAVSYHTDHWEEVEDQMEEQHG